MNANDEAITEKLVGFCSDLSFRDLPGPVVQRARDALLEFLGLALRGGTVDSSQMVRSWLREVASDGPSLAIGMGSSLAPQYAALANGSAAHALTLEDLHKGGSVHPNTVICSTAVAAGEATGASDEDLITAVVLGYEMIARLGLAVSAPEHYARGFHPSATCGTLAATSTAARLFGLSKEEATNALGIAGSFTGGSMQCLEDPAGNPILRLHAGWAAHCGILAATLAKKGFRAPSRIIEGSYGFLRAHSSKPLMQLALDGLGDSYQILNTGIKLHACCGYEHTPIDGVLSIMSRERLSPEEIEWIEVSLVAAGFPIVAEPEELRYDPKTPSEAQSSLPFGVALAVVERSGTIDLYTQENVDSPAIRRLMKKVRCRRDPELEKAFPSKWPAIVKIQTTDGRLFVERVDSARGDPENPVSSRDMIAKFESLTTGILTADCRGKIIRLVGDMPAGSTLPRLRKELAGIVADRIE